MNNLKKRAISVVLGIAFVLAAFAAPFTAGAANGSQLGYVDAAALADAFDSAANTQAPRRVAAVEKLRESNSDTYRLSDGSYECVVYAEDKYYLDDNGSFAEIDHSIVKAPQTRAGKQYGYKNAAGGVDVYFGADAPAVCIEANGESLAFSMLGARRIKGANPGGSSETRSVQDYALYGDDFIAYENVLADTDVIYQMTNGSLKEYILIKTPSAPSEFAFVFDAKDLIARTNEAGIIEFASSSGEAVFELGSLFAVDSNGEYTDALKYTVKETGKTGEYRITVSISADYLKAPERAFPVLVDPSVMLTGAGVTFDNYAYSLQNDEPNDFKDKYLRIGKDVPYGQRRTYIKFTLPESVVDGMIDSAYVRVKKHSGTAPTASLYRVTHDWDPQKITWSNMPSYSNSQSYSLVADSNDWYRAYVTGAVQTWADGTYPNYGFIIVDRTENDTSHWTTFYSSDAPYPNRPELVINYTSAASIYTITYYGNGNTYGNAPLSQSVKLGNSVALRANTGDMGKAGSCILLGWNTKADGTGMTYSLGQTIKPSSNMMLYAKWSNPSYPYRKPAIKVFVDKTYTDKYSNWVAQANSIASKAAYPFYQVYNIHFVLSSPSQMITSKSQCPNAPGTCTLASCGSDCNYHHTNANKILEYVSYHGSSAYPLNTLFYYGNAGCSRGEHDRLVGGLAYLPGSFPNLQSSIIECFTHTDWGTIRRVQHEWSHWYNARHSGDGGTNCTSDCINNNGWDNANYAVPDIWCSRCKAMMASHLGDY